MSTPPGLTDASDQDVIARVLQGNAEACRELHRRYEPRVQNLILRIVRDRDVADDLTQETSIKAFDALPSYQRERPFWPWIRTIAHRHAVDHLRGRKRESRAARSWLVETTPGRRLSEGVPAIDETPSDPFSLDVARFRQELNEALPRLAEHYRRCYERRDLEGRSYDDIAKETRRSTATARSYVDRARTQLREMLGSIRRFLVENSRLAE